MIDRILNVLFLCTGNSARSIMAEAVLQHRGRGRFKAFSAGSAPRGRVHPLALETLQRNNIQTTHFRSKSWDEFAGPGAPQMDFVFTVCDRAAAESCPLWPGHPASAHWGIADPDRPELPQDAQRQLFQRAYQELDHRIRIFTQLPVDELDPAALKKQLDMIGTSTAPAD